ncbi:hypothetical protein GH714_033427 [Hevea brasiliensis]|uniref:Mediator complex subunit 15 KIX domain-containing protein n=1 Tax=Hevea brasiliensis TaxID=3981 RepID=A0A6A6NDD3_HEVBR|nr:hypothetical protein GH714_033427 [Hevea brasiliensis]
MENTNWRPNAQGGEPAIDTGDWRAQLQPDSRHRIVNKIMETLKRQVPFSGQEGLGELKIIAIRFEEKIYTAAISQSDYLRKISLKMLTLESKSQKPVPNPLPPNPPGNNNRPSDPGDSITLLELLILYRATEVNAEQPMAVNEKTVSIDKPTKESDYNDLNSLSNVTSMQQNQLIGQQYNFGDMQQQQQRLLGQHNNDQNLQQQQQVMAQQHNLLIMHQQQLGSQSNVSGLQHQQQQHLLGTQPDNSSMQTNQYSVCMLQQPKVPWLQETAINLLPTQGQQSQSQLPQQQLMSQIQSLPTQFQQQLVLQEQSNPLQQDLQPRLQDQVKHQLPCFNSRL